MYVEHLLSSNRAIGKKQVDSLATEPGAAQRSVKPHRDLEEVHSGSLIHIANRRQMLLGHDQEMTWRHRIDVHERDHSRIVMYDAGREVTGEDVAEDASAHATIMATTRVRQSCAAAGAAQRQPWC